MFLVCVFLGLTFSSRGRVPIFLEGVTVYQIRSKCMFLARSPESPCSPGRPGILPPDLLKKRDGDGDRRNMGQSMGTMGAMDGTRDVSKPKSKSKKKIQVHVTGHSKPVTKVPSIAFKPHISVITKIAVSKPKITATPMPKTIIPSAALAKVFSNQTPKVFVKTVKIILSKPVLTAQSVTKSKPIAKLLSKPKPSSKPVAVPAIKAMPLVKDKPKSKSKVRTQTRIQTRTQTQKGGDGTSHTPDPGFWVNVGSAISGNDCSMPTKIDAPVDFPGIPIPTGSAYGVSSVYTGGLNSVLGAPGSTLPFTTSSTGWNT